MVSGMRGWRLCPACPSVLSWGPEYWMSKNITNIAGANQCAGYMKWNMAGA